MDPISLREKPMRAVVFAIVLTAGLSLLLAGCGEKPIGQPCNFGWPKQKIPGTDPPQFEPDCSRYPACHPLQSSQEASLLNNKACPVDCIQMPSLECENLICVATQIENNAGNMNGKCWAPGQGDEKDLDCPNANIRCMGYCTKECLTDASCPKGYKCSAMAPFSTTIECGETEEDEKNWSQMCTTTCTKDGAVPAGATDPCPKSGPGVNYEICNLTSHSECCTCICYQFCPILTKKFCRKNSWDDSMFETAIVDPSLGCGQD